MFLSPSPKKQKKLNRADGFVIGAVVMLAIVLFLGTWFFASRGKSSDLTCTVSQNGQVISSISLSTLTGSEELEVNGVCIIIDAHGAQVISSTCEGQDCVHQGTISKAGQSIVCLPNKVVVSLQGNQSDVDTVLG